MPIDLGLLVAGAAGSAVSHGVDEYRENQRYNDQKKLQSAMMARDNAKFGLLAKQAGFNYDPTMAGRTPDSAVDAQGLLKAQDDAGSAISQVKTPDQLSASDSGSSPSSSPNSGLLGVDKSLPTPTLPLTTGKSDYDINGFSETPEHKMTRQLEAKKVQTELSDYDPNDPAAQKKLAFNKGLLNKASPGLGDQIPEGTSNADLANNKFIDEAIKGGYGMQGRQMSNDRIMETNDIKRGTLTEKQNVNASKAGQAFESDPLLKQMKNTQYNLNRAKGMLDGSVPLNSKNFALLQQDMINATAPGGAATEGKVDREMVDTYAGKLNNLYTKLGDVKDIRDAQPAIVNQLRDLINEVGSEYTRGMSQQAKDIFDSFQQNSNPKVQETVKQKLQRYAPDEYAKQFGGRTAQSTGAGLLTSPASPAAVAHPQDSEAVMWAKSNPKDPRSAAILKANGM